MYCCAAVDIFACRTHITQKQNPQYFAVGGKKNYAFSVFNVMKAYFGVTVDEHNIQLIGRISKYQNI